ncbi:MAG TPA: cyanophycinase [Spirillospora sp.]|nr:cyanophycinase [Spirillospora sp.]
MPGILMPIGGAEDRRAGKSILKKFVDICGGSDARLLVVPLASSMPQETGSLYQHIFLSLGANRVTILDITTRSQANDPAVRRYLENTTGIFFSGGDQLRLLSLIGSTTLGDMIRTHYEQGVHIAGTSAGASAMSEQMIAFGRSGMTPSQRMVQTASGLGLSKSFIIDQHFSQRKRLGRLLTAVALHPRLVGLGIDEDTSLMIHPDGCGEVIGTGCVTVVDGRQLEYSDIYAAKRYEPFTLTGVDVRRLEAGSRVTLPAYGPMP